MDTRKSSKNRAVFFGAIAVLVLALVPAALAAKGGNGGGKNSVNIAGFELYVLDSSTSLWAENTQPSYGGTVKFAVPATVSAPNVELVCSQNGTVVYASLSGWYETSTWTRNMTLSSQAWTGGAADCTATLYHISGLRTVTDGTLSFTAGA